MTFSMILSVDPGGVTGYNYWLANDPTRPGLGWQQPYLDFVVWAKTFIRASPPGELVVVCEDFIINPETHRKPGSRWSLEQIGVLRCEAQDVNARFVLQTPSDAKQFCSNETLRQLGWYRPGRVHANDATRHLVLYFAKLGWYDGRTFTPSLVH